jgi:hypothetical protein
MTTASRLANHSTRAERVDLFEGPDTYEQASAIDRLVNETLTEKTSRGKHRWLVSRVTSK